MSRYPHVNREGVNELLSMPYDEPDMADVERVCDEVRHVQPVPRTLCLTLSDDRSLPLQCRFKLDHLGGHDWEIERGLAAVRAELSQDTPSGVLPVRVPGAALGAVRAESGSAHAENAAGPLEGEFEREVLETWKA